MKFRFIAIIIGILLLSACSSNSNASSNRSLKEALNTPSPVEILKNYHEAVVKKDLQIFKKLVMYREELKKVSNDELEKELTKGMENESDFIERVGGIDKIEYKEIKKEDMDEADIKRFDEKYDKNWTIIMANYGKFIEQIDTTVKPGSMLSFYFFKKVDGEYYMVSNDGGSIDQVVKRGKEDKYIQTKKD